METTESNAESAKKAAIMVVEDDRIVSTLVEHLLLRRGYAVHLAADGRAASAMLDEIEPPRLVLLDVMLPFVDGFEMIARIRGKESWNEIPIIMLTSKTQERNVVRALEAGADDYIVKPFQPQELVARVKRFIR